MTEVILPKTIINFEGKEVSVNPSVVPCEQCTRVTCLDILGQSGREKIITNPHGDVVHQTHPDVSIPDCRTRRIENSRSNSRAIDCNGKDM